MAKFNVGDKVKIHSSKNIKNFTGGWVPDLEDYIEEVHIIQGIDVVWSDNRVSYKLNGIPWTWDERCLEKVEDFENIVIKRDDYNVIAYSGKKQGIAKCSPSDDFDMYTGAKLALDRLFEKDKPKFEAGDIVRGNKLANDYYAITGEGYIGVVTYVYEDGTHIQIKGNDGRTFFVRVVAFDRVLYKDMLV